MNYSKLENFEHNGSGLVEKLKEAIKLLREEISSKNLIVKILAENINNNENLKSNNYLYNDFTCGNKNTKSKSCNNNLSNIPEKYFNVGNNFVEDKNAHSNISDFMNFDIPTSNRFDKLRTVENTQNDAKIDDVIEVDVSKVREIPFVKSSKNTVKKRPEVVINKYLGNNISLVKRIETQNVGKRPTLILHMVILKKVLVKLLCSQIVYQEIFGWANLISPQME